MKNYFKYAKTLFLSYLGVFATLLGIIAIIPIKRCIAIIVVCLCFVLAFLIPFVEAMCKKEFKVSTVGKSNIIFKFGDLFKEDCFVITTNLFFDVNPDGIYISEESLLGKFVNEFFSNNVSALEELINIELRKNGERAEKYDYGKCIRINFDNKIIYFLAFTDRNKSDQPPDFYEKTIKTFLSTIENENHGKTISVPIIGTNNNLSETGFPDLGIAFKCFMSMINSFEIIHQQSELKIRIVALPEKRAELINLVREYQNK